MVKRKRTNGQITDYKILYRKTEIEQYELHLKPEWKQVLRKGISSSCSKSDTHHVTVKPSTRETRVRQQLYLLTNILMLFLQFRSGMHIGIALANRLVIRNFRKYSILCDVYFGLFICLKYCGIISWSNMIRRRLKSFHLPLTSILFKSNNEYFILFMFKPFHWQGECTKFAYEIWRWQIIE